MKALDLLATKKRHKTAVLLGSGPSINSIPMKTWDKMAVSTDVWVLNNWQYHWFVPRFWHLELKAQFATAFLKTMKPRMEAFYSTTFVTPQGRIAHKTIGGFAQVISYPMTAPSLDTDHNYVFTNKIKHSCGASLTSLLEIVIRLGYEDIIMYGFDFTTAYYWSGRPDAHKQFNNPNAEHITLTKGVDKFIYGLAARFKPTGPRIFTGNSTDFLAAGLAVKEII